MLRGSQQKFLKLLRLSALLPRADKLLANRYKLSRKQIYLIYLIYLDSPQLKNLKDFADILNISSSTLTRNVEKLEDRKILQRVTAIGRKDVSLKLLSLGQVYAVDIDNSIHEYFKSLGVSIDI